MAMITVSSRGASPSGLTKSMDNLKQRRENETEVPVCEHIRAQRNGAEPRRRSVISPSPLLAGTVFSALLSGLISRTLPDGDLLLRRPGEEKGQ
jgi:hypothetical protein